MTVMKMLTPVTVTERRATSTPAATGATTAATTGVTSLGTIDPFISAYRDSLERQRDLSMQSLDNTRRNDFATIMAGANKAGMLYSNFPQRDKIKYDTQNYVPNQAKIQQGYQTGLQKLRENTINMANQLKTINEAIAELNAA